MNIITKDTRELTDVTPIDFKSREITFHEMKITGNFASDIEDMLEGNLDLINFDFTKIQFNGNIEIFDIGGNLFIIGYIDKSLRDTDIELLKQNFQEDGKFAKELGEKRQVPEFEGYFDYNGKYFLIVNGLNKLTHEINPNLGVYKGVIVNLKKYFEVEDETKEVIGKVNDTLK